MVNTKQTTKPAAKKPVSDKNWIEAGCELPKLNDKDIISDVLGCHKGLVKRYGDALCESSTNKLRSMVTTNMTECASDQFDAFMYMSDHGLYPTEVAPAQKVTQAKQKFCTCENEMNK